MTLERRGRFVDWTRLYLYTDEPCCRCEDQWWDAYRHKPSHSPRSGT